jgi:hypothetical protein
MAKPIFVIGNNRSGTKWISNLLLGHPDIAGIQSPNHNGILETGLLTVFPDMFGPLANPNGRIGCIECFAATDYFRLTGFDKEVLYQLPVENYYDFFRALMDRLAQERGAAWWLQKFSPIVLPGLMRHFPDARYVIITRYVPPTIRSNMKTAGDPPRWWSAIQHLYWYHYGIRQMQPYRDQPGVLSLRYETLLAETETTVRWLCTELGLVFTPDMLEVRFQRNNRFNGSGSAKDYMSDSFQRRIRGLSVPFSLLPLWVFRVIHRCHRFFKRHRSPFLPTSFSIVASERNLARSAAGGGGQTTLANERGPSE